MWERKQIGSWNFFVYNYCLYGFWSISWSVGFTKMFFCSCLVALTCTDFFFFSSFGLRTDCLYPYLAESVFSMETFCKSLYPFILEGFWYLICLTEKYTYMVTWYLDLWFFWIKGTTMSCLLNYPSCSTCSHLYVLFLQALSRREYGMYYWMRP